MSAALPGYGKVIGRRMINSLLWRITAVSTAQRQKQNNVYKESTLITQIFQEMEENSAENHILSCMKGSNFQKNF